MTDESICARCAEMIRIRFKNYEEEERICGIEAIGRDIMGSGATVEECSRFAEVPERVETREPNPWPIEEDR